MSAFVVLCGCPRSGTTLLGDLLARRFGVAMPLETQLIPQFGRWVWLWRSLDAHAGSERLLAAMEMYTRVWLSRGTRISNLEGPGSPTLLPELETIPASPGTYSTHLHALFGAFARRVAMPHYGDKSAPFEPQPLDDFERHVEGMKVVHLIRDGRDVCLSWRETWFGPRSTGEAAVMWRRHVTSYQAWGRRHPERYLEVSYEALARSPDDELGRIGRFLSVAPLPPDRQRPVLAGVMSQQQTHSRLSGPVDAASVGRWAAGMPSRDVALFEFAAGAQLLSAGYRVGPRPAGRQWAVLAARLAGAWLRRYASRLYYLRTVRSLLPPALALGQYCGLVRQRRASSRSDSRLG